MEEEEVRRSDEDLKAAASGVRRPMNAFLIFCKRHRRLVREKNPHLDNRSVTRNLGELWANLPPEEKATYTSVANEYKEAFMKANPDYKWFNPDKTGGVSREKPTTRPTNSLTSYIGQVPHTDDSSETPAQLENTPCTEDFLGGNSSPSKFSGSSNFGGVSMLLMASNQTLPPGGGQVNCTSSAPVSAAAPPSVTLASHNNLPPGVTLSGIPAAVSHPYIVSTQPPLANITLQPEQTIAGQTYIHPVSIATSSHTMSFGAHPNLPFISPVYSKNGAIPLTKTLPQSTPVASTLVSPHITPGVAMVTDAQRLWNPLEKANQVPNVPKTQPRKEEKSLNTLFDLAQMCFSEAEKQVTAKLPPQPFPISVNTAHPFTTILSSAPPAHMVAPAWATKYPEISPMQQDLPEEKLQDCTGAVDFSLKKKPDIVTTQKVATSTQVDPPGYHSNSDNGTSQVSPLNYHSDALAKFKSLGVEKSFVAPPKDTSRTPGMPKTGFGVGKLFMEHVIESMYSSEFSQTKIPEKKLKGTSEPAEKNNSDKLAAASAITSLSSIPRATLPKHPVERSRDLSLDARSRVDVKTTNPNLERERKHSLTFGEIQETLIRKAVENSLDLGITCSSESEKSSSRFRNEDKENHQCHFKPAVVDTVKETPGACGKSYDLAKNASPVDEVKVSLGNTNPYVSNAKSTNECKSKTNGFSAPVDCINPGARITNVPTLDGAPIPSDSKLPPGVAKLPENIHNIETNMDIKSSPSFGTMCCPSSGGIGMDEKEGQFHSRNCSSPCDRFTSVKDIKDYKSVGEDVRWTADGSDGHLGEIRGVSQTLPPTSSLENDTPTKYDPDSVKHDPDSHQSAQSSQQPDDTHSSNDEMGEGHGAQVKDVSVRKSKRSNRGRRYQELIDQGYLQPAREKPTPAVRKSFSSDISDVEPMTPSETNSPPNGRKRTFSETDAAAGNSEDSTEKRYKTGDFDLEAHIASLPVCHIDEIGRKGTTKVKGHTKVRHCSENSGLQRPAASGPNPGLVNVAELKQVMRPACQAGAAPVSGSKRRKARKTAITHLIMAPANEVDKGAAGNNNNNDSGSSNLTKTFESQPKVSAHVTMEIRPASDGTLTNNNNNNGFEKAKPAAVVVSCP